MTSASINNAMLRSSLLAKTLGPWRLLLPILFALLCVQDPAVINIIYTSVGDAFIQVSVFVAATLALFYSLEKIFKLDTAELLNRHSRLQVPIAALLGALPGCGGAIMVVTQYVRGNISFGAFVAVLTSTMGDAAFLLLARDPAIALMIFATGIVVGTCSGYVIDALLGKDYRVSENTNSLSEADVASANAIANNKVLRPFWVAITVVGTVFGVFAAFQQTITVSFGSYGDVNVGLILGFVGGVLAVLMWSYLPVVHSYRALVAEHDMATGDSATKVLQPFRTDVSTTVRVINDTNFVTVWVVIAYLVYELGIHFSGIDLKSWFALWAPLAPMIGVVIGFLPGCGPQIVVTTLYLNGVVPLSAQLGNAISNDGDALFPAIALAPRTAIIATLYSAIPAFIVAYAYYFLVEM